jgi:hypothetical protein
MDAIGDALTHPHAEGPSLAYKVMFVWAVAFEKAVVASELWKSSCGKQL